MSEITDLLFRFKRGQNVIEDAVRSVTADELDYQPVPGKWSIREIIAHLADVECLAVCRFRQLIAEDNPSWGAIDQDAWAARTNYPKREIADSLEVIRVLRRENYFLLRDLSDQAYSRTAIHFKYGKLSLLDYLRIITEHPEKHVRQIESLRAALRAERQLPK